VYNAIILPILTYVAPVWYTGQAYLLKELCGAQNLAIRHIAGAFCTSPVEPLHELMAILPIDLCLKLLVKNMTLHFYKIPLNSQLIAWVLGSWGDPKLGLLPLSVTSPPCSQSHTNLGKLAVQAPAGPHLNILATPP
jgi:hypothetical protein